jgi:hypothetical protein
MKQHEKQTGIMILSLLSVPPTGYFICVILLKHQVGVDACFQAITPFLERMPFWIFI